MALRRVSSGARASIVNATSPAITLTAPGRTSAAPTVATVSRAPGADALDRGDHLGRRRERVAAHRHRHGAGMAGLARHERAGPGDAGDRRDDPDGEVLRFEQRALLDVNLEIADDVLAAAGERRDGVRVAAEG